MGAQRITSNSKFYLALFKFIFLKTHRLYYFIDHHISHHITRTHSKDKMAAGFASMLPMVEPRASQPMAEQTPDYSEEVAKLRETLQKNVDALTNVADKNDTTAEILKVYSDKSFALLDDAPRTRPGLEQFLVQYADLTHCAETFLVLHAAVDTIKDRLLDVIDMLRGIEVAPERASIKEQNIGFLNENLSKLNSCFEMKGLTFDYNAHIAPLNMCLEYHARRGRIYDMVTNCEAQVNEAKKASTPASK